MKYHSFFFSKIRKDVALSSAAVMIGALRVNQDMPYSLSPSVVC